MEEWASLGLGCNLLRHCAPSYASLAASRAGAVAEMVENGKSAQYTHLRSTHLFVPVSVEMSGFFGEESLHFLRELVSTETEGHDAFHCLLQRLTLSVAIQRGNAISIMHFSAKALK